MKEILDYLKKYIKEHFHLGLYTSVILFLTTTTYFNYIFDFEDSIIDSFRGTLWHWLYMSLFMGFPFLTICLLTHWWGQEKTWIKSKEFWLLFVLGFVLLGFNRTFYFHDEWMKELDFADLKFVRSIIWRGKSFLIIFGPIMLFYYWYEKNKDTSKDWYGLTLQNTDFKPYVILLIFVFVGIGCASFLSDLTNYYPRYLRSGGEAFAQKHGWSSWIPVVLYQGTYGANFLNVELFFRGFLVIGFSRVLGGHAVLAMVGSYMFLHYGKPMTEAISSGLGGYLLGILAFYSRRIWGGVVLHVALAWFMELFAWLQKIYNS